MDNGFAHYSSGGVLRTPFVEEVSPGVARVTFTVSGGINTKDKRLLSLPEWAIPLYSSWHTCNIRNSSGTSLATVDVLGKLSGKKGDVVLGLDWGTRTIWANGSFTYDLN